LPYLDDSGQCLSGILIVSDEQDYRTLELPGQNPLKEAHAALDAAVLAAYGFSAKKDLLAQLLELNLAMAARIERGETVTAPGIPPDFPDPDSLITTDCIRPAETL
jgi:hypothetical protein